MNQRMQPTNYSRLAKFFHWSVALIVIPMLMVSFFLDDVPKAMMPTAFMIHKSFGLTVLLLMLLRFLWMHFSGRPALPANMPTWERVLAKSVQHSLYLFVILMPICGWVMSVASNKIPLFFGLFPLPIPGLSPNEALATFMNQAHKTIAWIIIGLLVLHIAGALKHHFIDKDDVLRRML